MSCKSILWSKSLSLQCWRVSHKAQLPLNIQASVLKVDGWLHGSLIAPILRAPAVLIIPALGSWQGWATWMQRDRSGWKSQHGSPWTDKKSLHKSIPSKFSLFKSFHLFSRTPKKRGFSPGAAVSVSIFRLWQSYCRLEESTTWPISLSLLCKSRSGFISLGTSMLHLNWYCW